MRRNRAFTLVELLVVIGIIGLLISILLPALNKARQQAVRVKCQSNMRTLVLATTMYASEHNAQLPFCNWGTPDAPDGTYLYKEGWLFCDASLRTAAAFPGKDVVGNWGTNPPIDGVITGNLWQYIRNLGIYHCPLDDASYWQNCHRLTSYLMNGAECGYNDNPQALGLRRHPGLKITQFRRSAECCIFWEAMEGKFGGATGSGAVWNDGASYPSEEVLSDRHYKGANIAFLDGHVEWWPPDQYYRLAGPPLMAAGYDKGPNALWCSPLTPDGH